MSVYVGQCNYDLFIINNSTWSIYICEIFIELSNTKNV